MVTANVAKMYSAVVLYPESQRKLINHMIVFLKDAMEEMDEHLPSWEHIGHHMTIKMGGLTDTPYEAYLGTEAILEAYEYAYDDKVIAVKVATDVPSKNKVKHITCFVNRENGGKPYLSNKLTNWTKLPMNILLYGEVQEVK